MTLVAGVSHRTVSRDVLGALAFAPDAQPLVLGELVGNWGLQEAVVLSTCNRVEIYARGPEPAESSLISFLTGFHGVSAQLVSGGVYEHRGEAAAAHLFRVAAGLDSAIVGDQQIVGQVRRAFRIADGMGSVGAGLRPLFEAALHTAKLVRRSAFGGPGSPSLASAAAAVVVGPRRGRPPAAPRVLVVGAGEMGGLAALELHAAGAREIVVASRDLRHARATADSVGAEPVALAGLADALAWADATICATASREPVIDAALVRRAFRRRSRSSDRHLMIDLAVPRDVAEDVGALAEVELIGGSELYRSLPPEARPAARDVARAELVVAEQLERCLARRRLRHASVAAFR